MRYESIFGLTCLLGLCISLQADEKTSGKLDGPWKLVAVEVDGKEAELPMTAIVWEIKGAEVLYSGEELAKIIVDSMTTPKTIDLEFPATKKQYEAIYECDAETLKICVNTQTVGVRQRPTSLETKDHRDLRLLVFTRATPTELQERTGYAGMALQLDEETGEVQINMVLPDSPAKKAGLQEEDVLLSVSGQPIPDLMAAVDVLRRTAPGTELVLKVRRDDQQKSINLTVGVFPFTLFGILD